jgi:hypothetical protein
MKAANSCSFEKSVFWIGLYICDMDRPAFKNCPADNGPSTDFQRVGFHELIKRGRVTEIGNLPVYVASLSID